MENDPREVGWTEKQVARLDEAIVKVQQMAENLQDNIGDFEPEDEDETTTIWNEINRLTKEIQMMRRGLSSRGVARLDTLSGELKRSVDRISKLEARLERGEPGDEEVQPWEMWAESQIAKLGAAVTGLKMNVFTDAGFNRITEVAKRVTAETDRLNELRAQIAAVENRMLGHRERLDNIEASYVTEPRFFDLIGRVRALEASLIKGSSFGSLPILADEENFSAPIGAGLSEREIMDGVEESQMRADADRKRKIVDRTLAEAEKRIRRYMEGHFSEATIRGVVEAVRTPY